ncbi:MAG TPA: VOC family protein [Baekduia sp.]|nr:VOC family protein [Baekduia sp.]
MTLQHASLETRPADVEAEVAFWALLGFARVEPPGTLGERSAWVQAGATQIHLLFADEPVVPASGHVAVVCADYDATTAALRAAGFDVEERTHHWGAARCFTRSPGGHRVEVMAAPPA